MDELYGKDEQKQQIKQDYTAVYTLGFVVILLAGFLGYTYYTKDMVKKGDLDRSYIKKDEITFNDLPNYLQSDYILKNEHNQKVSQLNQQINHLSSQTKSSYTSSNTTETLEKVVEVEKIVEVEKPVTIVKDTSNIDKTKYESFGCYEMVSGDFYSSKNCIDKLHDFLDRNKGARLFEVIGVYNNEEFDVVKTITDEQEKKNLKKIFDLAQIGLVEKRVTEGIWQVKNHLGFSTNVKKVNYDIKSQYGLKGFVVRAYK